MPNFLEDELAPHFQAWKQTPNPDTAGQLLQALEPTARSALTTYTGSLASSPTLASRAKVIMLKALPHYDPAQAKLRTYMMYQLQSLRRAAAREERATVAPEQVLLDLGHLHESTNLLQDRLGRDPSDQELADHTGLSKKRLAYIRTIRPNFAEGSMVRNNEGSLEPFAPAVEQAPGQAWHEFVYQDLEPTDQLIMEHTLGLHGKPILPNNQLAGKLRLSPGAVSQRKARIQSKLDQQAELRLF